MKIKRGQKKFTEFDINITVQNEDDLRFLQNFLRMDVSIPKLYEENFDDEYCVRTFMHNLLESIQDKK